MKKALPPREELRDYLLSFDLFRRLGRPEEGEEYVLFHLDRFIRSLEFLPALSGDVAVLELGASPYFMTLLIQKYLGYRVTPANFFEDYGASAKPGEHLQPVASTAFGEDHIFRYRMFNIERDPFPYPDASFDLVLCCEILEHLVMDPSHMLREAHRVLKPGGILRMECPDAAKGCGQWQDPTHVSAWTPNGLQYFEQGSPAHLRFAKPYGITARFKILILEERNYFPLAGGPGGLRCEVWKFAAVLEAVK